MKRGGRGDGGSVKGTRLHGAAGAGDAGERAPTSVGRFFVWRTLTTNFLGKTHRQ
jgi:hypothetical protein